MTERAKPNIDTEFADEYHRWLRWQDEEREAENDRGKLHEWYQACGVKLPVVPEAEE